MKVFDIKSLYAILFIVMSTFSYATFAASASAINTKGFGNSYAIKGYDPVAYWHNSEPRKGKKQFKAEWRDATWLFSNQSNLDSFKSNPEKYAPQYGGYCAWAMADGKGRTVKIDPEAWHIYNDKLYLNYNLKVRGEWLKTKAQDVAIADVNYPNITDVKKYKK